MQKLAHLRGGECLSKKYINVKTVLKWKCKYGHVWKSKPGHVRNGSWCPYCAGQRLTLQDMKRIARGRKGKCLSDTYLGSKTPLEFQCKKGHKWRAKPSMVKHSTWCPYCVGRKKTIKDLQALAKKRGGKCLSKKYTKNYDKYKWQCKKGHTWQTTYNSIQQGQWCPRCAGNIVTIQDMKKIARSRNGKCLSDTYVDAITHLEWKCDKGHKWKAIPAYIKRGSWCPYCNGFIKTIEDMQEFARKKGGKCLSKKHIGALTKLKWKCEQGHIWEATPASIQSGSWCPYCVGRYKTRKDLQALAKKRGGKCLSKKYTKSTVKYKWQCKKGHTWHALYNNIQQGQWCPYCSGQRVTIQDMKRIARSRKGKCLSDSYVNSTTHLKWQCEKGHTWRAIPSYIKQGSWCPYCKGLIKTIEDMKELARKQGGKCLSKEYINTVTHLEWKCHRHHRFWMTPSKVQMGRWCPECRKIDGRRKQKTVKISRQKLRY
jgi:hypothetical protein